MQNTLDPEKIFGPAAGERLIGRDGEVFAVVESTMDTARRLDLHRFFTVTGVLLIVFAAGLFAQGLHEFQEAGVLPAFLEHLWDTSTILPEDGPLGSLLKGLVGYSASPSLLMVTGYVGYWAVVASAYLAWKPSRPAEGSAKPKRL